MNTEEDFSIIIKNATDIKKEKGIDDALGFLISIYMERNLDDQSVSQLLSKIKIYAPKSQKYSKEEVIKLFDEAINKITNPIYKVDCLEDFGDLYNRYNLPIDAEKCIKNAIANLNPYMLTNYLYKAFGLYRQLAFTIKNTGRSQEKIDKGYLYYFLCAELLVVAWDLFVLGKQNIDYFLLYQGTNVKPKFTPFTNYEGYIKSLNDDFPFEENDYPTEALQRISKGKDIKKYSIMFQDFISNKLPEALGFKQEFLSPKFNDVKEFVMAFVNEKNEIIFENVVPSKAIGVSNDLVNQLLNDAYSAPN